MNEDQTTLAHEKIVQTSDHPVVQEVSGLVREGMSFQEILDKYTKEQNLDPDKIAEIHEYKSRIQEALRIGTPLAEVIDSVFSDDQIKQEIMQSISKYKANRPN